MAYKIGSLFDGLYVITGSGELYSTRSKKFLKPATDKFGYLYYVISINGKRRTLKAHRLVAMAFIPNPYGKPTVNHKNGIRSDNRVENLEWATAKEQSKDAIARGSLQALWSRTDYRSMGEKRNFGRKKVSVSKKDGKIIGEYESLKEAASENGVSYSKASECANGKRKSSGGVVFCFV